MGKDREGKYHPRKGKPSGSSKEGVGDAITGNYEHAEISSLYSQAREKMEPYFGDRITRALHAFGNQSATDLTSSIPDDIIPAAHYGRISQLFAQKDEHYLGQV